MERVGAIHDRGDRAGLDHLLEHPSNEYPHLARFVNEHIMRPGYEFAEEFEYGLDLILDALEREVDHHLARPQ